MELDVQSLADRAMPDGSTVSLLEALKRMCISQYLQEDAGIASRIEVVSVERIQEIEREGRILLATKADVFMAKDFRSILGKDQYNVSPQTNLEKVQTETMRTIVTTMGGSIEFDFDILREVAQQARMTVLKKKNMLDTTNQAFAITNILLSVVRQRVRDVFSSLHLTSDAPYETVMSDNPSVSMVIDSQNGFNETVTLVGKRMGYHLNGTGQ